MPSNATETIDARILRLIGLEDTFDLDYDTYLTLLKEAMVKGRMPKTTIPSEEVELLTDEWKRVKSKKDKGRFKVKKKKISASVLSGTGVGVKSKTSVVSTQKLLPGTGGDASSGGWLTDIFENISQSLQSIVNTLREQKKVFNKKGEFDKRAAENEKRAESKNKLKDRFKTLKKVTDKVIKPVKSLFDKIINFFMMIILGRVFVKLLNWFGDPRNKSKIDSLIRFLTDFGPKLLMLYIAFGTGFGKAIRKLINVVVSGTARLAAATAGLLAKAGLKGMGRFSRFFGKYGKAIGVAAEIGATVWAGQALQGALTENSEEQAFSGGGLAQPQPQPAFSGGGFNFGGALKGAALGSLLGPLGMLTGGALGGGIKPKKDDRAISDGGGEVSGTKGVDQIPAYLTDGEFVMSKGAVQKYGVDTLEGMNAAGGGTNQPTWVASDMAAFGGGLMRAFAGGGRVHTDTESGKSNPDDGTPAVNIKRKPSSKTTSGGGLAQWMHGNRKPTRKVLGGGDLDIPGHGTQATAHDHFGFSSRAAAVNAFKALQKAGYSPYEFEGFTRVGRHSLRGGHFGPMGDAGAKARGRKDDGTAFDVPWSTSPYGISGPIGARDFAASNKAASIVAGISGAMDMNIDYAGSYSGPDPATGAPGSLPSTGPSTGLSSPVGSTTRSNTSSDSLKGEVPGAEDPGPRPIPPKMTKRTGTGNRKLGREHRRKLREWENKKKRYNLVKDSVMAPKEGRAGWLNTKTGKWTPADWTGADKERYEEKGGELTELKPQGFMRGLAGFGDILTMGLTDFDRRGSVTEGRWQLDPISGGADNQWGSERYLSKNQAEVKAPPPPTKSQKPKLANLGADYAAQEKKAFEAAGDGSQIPPGINSKSGEPSLIQKVAGIFGW